MEFPDSIYWKNRPILPKHRIKLLNYMYARFKPGINWREGDEFPDFNSIKVDQSFNWNAYSIPLWVLFNPDNEFLENYGVVAFSVRSLVRNKNLLPEFSNYFHLEHKPIINNYSHCELVAAFPTNNKEIKRQIRMSFKHNCKPLFKPDSKKITKSQFIDRLNMLKHLIYTKIIFLK